MTSRRPAIARDISGPSSASSELYYAADRIIPMLKKGAVKEDRDTGRTVRSYTGDYTIDEKDRLVSAFETRYFGRLLKRTEGNVSKAARLAGIHRKSLEYLLKQLDLARDAEP